MKLHYKSVGGSDFLRLEKETTNIIEFVTGKKISELNLEVEVKKDGSGMKVNFKEG